MAISRSPEEMFFYHNSMIGSKDRYERKRRGIRRRYGIKEGDWVCVKRKDPHDADKTVNVNVKIVAINQYHVTIMFPERYCESPQWIDFENMMV